MDAGSEDWYAMRVLDAIISGIGYPGGWLHDTLRGQQLVYIVHAWNYALKGKGYFAVMAATSPATADSALGVIRGKIAKVKNEYVTDEEIELAKRVCNIMEDLYFSQTTAAQANLATQYEVLGLGYDYRARLRERIGAVTKEDVMEVARKYLNESATILIRPEETAFNSSAETGM
jgi:zinc protease